MREAGASLKHLQVTRTVVAVSNASTVPQPALDEKLRLAALRACEILDTLPEAEFDDLVELAQHACGTMAAAISFIDSDRQWLKASRGPLRGVAREHAFCSHAIQGRSALVVRNALDDPRFRDNPYVAGEPRLRFYAGVPLVTSEGARVGALCVLDSEARTIHDAQLRVLEILARQISALLDLRRHKAALHAAEGERDAAVARLELTTSIHGIAEEHALPSALREAVRAIAGRGGWAAGAAWLVRASDSPLMNVGGYWVDDPAHASVEQASLQASFTRAVGLPGAAWRSGAPLWLENLVDEPGMLRVAAMRAAGLASGVAVPVVASAQVIGVLEFLSATPRPRAEDELDLLLHGAREVAALLARRSSRRQDAGDG